MIEANKSNELVIMLRLTDSDALKFLRLLENTSNNPMDTHEKPIQDFAKVLLSELS